MIAHDPLSEPRDGVGMAERNVFPCSQSQVRFWIEEQVSPRNPALNVAVRWRLDGLLAHSVLEEAWRRIINRHDPLRTAFATVDEQPVQVVEPHVAFTIPIVDLRALPESLRSGQADRLAEQEAQLPFDIATAPLIRVTRIILGDSATMLLVTAHHTVCDGWSIGILAREMGQICAALTAGAAPFLPELGFTFGEFAAWESEQIASGSLENEREYVRAMLRDYHQFELLADHARPRRLTSNGAISSLLLDRAITDGLAQLARNNGCTLFMTALAALFVLFHRYTGETDIVLGTQVVGRDDEDLEKLVGCFINTIALRGDVSGAPDFITVLDRTREMVSDSFDVRALPLQQLIEIARPIRDPSRNALFSVNFIFQRSFITNETYDTFALVDLPSRSAGALFDVNMFMVERPEGWRLSCEYNTDLFDARTISELLDRFCTLLSAILADPTQAVGQLELLRPADRVALIVEANRTEADYPSGLTLPQLIAAQVARTPNAPAVVCAQRSLTYAALNAAVKRLARDIAGRGCGPGMRVGILLDRSPEMVVAMLAVLEAGCAYVPLDPKFPPDRLAFIAADAELGATITRSTLVPQFRFVGTDPILVDAQTTAIAQHPEAPVPTSPDDLAYVIYTSGSTGRPKGVQITQRSLVNLLCAMRERPGLSAHDTFVAVATISFDIAGLELFLPLVTGAKLVIATDTDVVDGAALLGLMQRTAATVVQATPVTWQLLIDAGWDGDPAVGVWCGGEALSRSLADQLLDRGSEVWNLYGPTETTIWSAAVRVTPGTGPVFIGPPIANTQLYVLDGNGELVPPGVAGELYIGGDGVALGYHQRAELTRERFVPDVFRDKPGATLYRTGDVVRTRAGGCFEFLGRTDHQVKLRGFRIELDEIGAALLRQPGVADVVVISAADGKGEPSIRAYVAAHADAGPDVDTWPALLRARIADFLPAYMVPAAIVVLERLPRTPSGKIDRAALPLTKPQPPGGLDDPARTATEIAVATIAQELIGMSRIGRNDDLFVLGFHSLLAVRLVARIARSFGVALSLRSVFEFPTIAGIADSVDQLIQAADPADRRAATPLVVYHAQAPGPPLVFFHSDAQAEGLYCRRLSKAIGVTQKFIAVAPHGSAGLPVFSTIEEMARDAVARLREVQPAGPYRIAGHCVGGIVAFEVARLLQAQGDLVDDIVLVNAYAPCRSRIPGVDGLQRRIGLDASLGWRLREKLCLNIARFAECIDRGPKAVLRFLRVRFGTVTRLRERERQNAIAHPEIFERTPGTHETEAYFAYTIAGFTYHPEPYAGDITLVLSENEEVSMGDPNVGDPTIGWGRLARAVRVVPIQGGHNSPVQERVEELGGLIAAAFSRQGTAS